MCFELLVKLSNFAMVQAPEFSSKILTGTAFFTCNLRSFKIPSRKRVSVAAPERATFSANVDDWATEFCFLVFQKMGFPKRWITYPEADLWSTVSPALSAPTEQSSIWTVFLLQVNFKSFAKWRYSKIRSAYWKCVFDTEFWNPLR